MDRILEPEAREGASRGSEAAGPGASGSVLKKSLRGMDYDQGMAAMAPDRDELATARAGLSGLSGPLPGADRVSASLGADMSGVKAHTGPAAQAACQALGARAYAVDQSIAFATPSPGLALQGHEAAHVIQQGGGAGDGVVQAKGSGGVPDLEAEADAAGAAVESGQPFTVQGSASGLVQRDADPDADTDADTDAGDTVVEFNGTREISGVEGHHIRDTRQVGADGMNVTGTVAHEAQVIDDAGNTVVTGHSTTGRAGMDGVQVGHGRSTGDGTTTTTNSGTAGVATDGTVAVGGAHTVAVQEGEGPDAYRRSTTTSANATANVAEGQYGVGVNHSINDNGQTTSVGASGTVDFDPNGRIEGAGGAVNFTSDGVAVNFGGSFRVSANEPQQQGDVWVVSWTNSSTATGGGGVSNDRAGASGSITHSASTGGSERFATLQQAQEFYASGDWALRGLDDAASLDAGETLTATEGNGAQLGANARLAGVTVGGSITLGDSRSVVVTGLGDQHVEVRITDTTMLGGSASVGAGATLTFGISSRDFAGAIVRFDLGTSQGQRAYDLFVDTSIVSASGAELIATFTGEGSTETQGVGVAGASLTNSNDTSETVTEYTDGRRVEERTGTETTGITVPLIGSYSESDGIAATEDSTQENRTYRVTSTVTGSSTQDVVRGIGSSTGHAANTIQSHEELDDQAQRRWSITSSFTQAQIERLVEYARAGRFNASSLIFQAGDGRDFMEEVSAAGDDWDRIDRALSEFVSETGDSGLALIRRTISVDPSYDLRLEGDPYMTGEAGHAALARTMRSYRDRLQGGRDVSRLAADVSGTLEAQRTRLAAVSDPAQYPDLPQTLRHEEARRTEYEIAELETLRGEVVDAIEAARSQRSSRSGGAAVDTARDATESSGQAEPLEPQMSEAAGYEDLEMGQSVPSDEAVLAQAIEREWSEMMAFEQRALAKQAAAREAGNTCRRHHWIHVDGAYAFRRSAYEEWGQTGLFSDGEHVEDYRQANDHKYVGEDYWQTASGHHRTYQRAKEAVEVERLTNPEAVAGTLVDRLGTHLSSMHDDFGMAEVWFNRANRIFESIRSQHRDSINNHFQAYRDGRRLPDEREL